MSKYGKTANEKSLPSRGAWIEILIFICFDNFFWLSLPSRGAWIEIWYAGNSYKKAVRRSPHGERGLK